MGVYYHFLNVSKNIKNVKGLKQNGGLAWIPKFDGNVEIFKQVIELNGWSEDDDICAYADDGSSFLYSKGEVTYEDEGCYFTEND